MMVTTVAIIIIIGPATAAADATTVEADATMVVTDATTVMADAVAVVTPTKNRNNTNCHQNWGLYCWTHGNCTHTSGECSTTADIHKANAIFVNIQVDSRRNCSWQSGTVDSKINHVYSTLYTVLPPKKYTPTSNYYDVLSDTVDALIDTAASHHYVQDDTEHICTNICKKEGPPVTVANGNTIAPHSDAKISLSDKLSQKAQHAFLGWQS